MDLKPDASASLNWIDQLSRDETEEVSSLDSKAKKMTLMALTSRPGQLAGKRMGSFGWKDKSEFFSDILSSDSHSHKAASGLCLSGNLLSLQIIWNHESPVDLFPKDFLKALYSRPSLMLVHSVVLGNTKLGTLARLADLMVISLTGLDYDGMYLNYKNDQIFLSFLSSDPRLELVNKLFPDIYVKSPYVFQIGSFRLELDDEQKETTLNLLRSLRPTMVLSNVMSSDLAYEFNSESGNFQATNPLYNKRSGSESLFKHLYMDESDVKADPEEEE